MWKEYSSGYIKNNRASSISILAASFICALLLSFLCSLFYNFWAGEVEWGIKKDGDWHARITRELSKDEITAIQNFGSVKKAAVNKALTEENGTMVVDIYFENMRSTYKDMPRLAGHLDLKDSVISYNDLLLSRYLIHDPADESPPLLLTFYLFILAMVSLSLILIIRNSFAMSMNARIRQFGILSSIGAAPAQIRACLMQEAAILCALPVLSGCLTGILLSIGVVQAMNQIAEHIAGAYASNWTYHPMVLAVTILSTAFTVLFSAWLPARKLSRMSPLEAIRNTGELQLRRKHSPRILPLLFGLEGELAGNALKAQAKAMRTSTLSLTLSFLGFTLFLCFFTLSGISTQHTYFEKYQNAWDVMAVIKNTNIEDFEETEELRELSGARDLIAYQKAEAVCLVSQENLSTELKTIGGPEVAASGGEAAFSRAGELWQVRAPVIILDDRGFLEYCESLGLAPRLDGTVILNRIWDSTSSVWRYPDYIPFLADTKQTTVLQSTQGNSETARLPVLGFVQQPPVLREEYEQFTLVHFIPLSLWKTISPELGPAKPDTYVRLLAEERNELSSLSALQQKAEHLLTPRYETEIENRIQEKIVNDEMIWGYTLILGGLCCILALIGIANVFSNTLGFLRQRKREFARYLSVGMTPAGIRKMFCVEALVIAGRPVLITLPLTAAATGYMIKISYLNPMEFMEKAPVIPIIIFCITVFGFVGLAYYLGARKVMRYNLSEALRDDTNGL